jgi:hypothetical protein
MLHAIDLPNAGRLCAEGAEMNIPLVGVPWRVIVRASVLPCAGLRVGGLQLQASQLGSAAFLSASRQEKGDRRGKAVHGNSEIRWAAGCRRLAAVGVIVPVGEVDVAKLMSATALPLAWFTQTKSGVEFASTPIWTVPHVVKSGVVGAASVP